MKYAKLESAAYRKGRKLAAKRGLDLALLDAVVTILLDTGTHDDIFRR